MKRRCFSLLLALLMALTFTSVATAQGNYTPGSYTATVQGHNDKLTLTVEVDEKAIIAITIGDHSETAGIATPVLENFPKLIIENQSLNIDAVSGATVTSQAVLAAVADAVTQAGGNVQALKTKEVATKEAGEPIEETVDVVVVGAGGAGLAAAAKASELGASVIILEKGAAVGGNTLRAGGAYNAVDPQRQEELATDDSQINELKQILEINPDTFAEEYRDTLNTLQEQIEAYLSSNQEGMFDSIELHIYHTYIGGRRTGLDGSEVYGNFELINTLTENALPSLEWVAKQDNLTISNNIYTVLGALWPRTHSLEASVGHGFIDPLLKASEQNGAKVMLNTRGESIIMENGRAVGVKAFQSDGTPVTIHAVKGIVLATGGFGANPKMAMEYDNYWGVLSEEMPTTNTTLSTGDGITMAKEAGANLTGMGYIQLMPSSQPVTGSLGGGVWGSAESQVFVNQEGKRFVSEYESRDVMAKAALEQKDGIFYIICDQVTAGDPKPGDKNGWGNDIDTLIAEGSVLKADTLEDLALQMGCDPEVFVAEISRYNQFTQSGSDEDFNKTKLGKALDQAPFYATIRTPSIHHTMGGVQINAMAQALNESGDVIPGLYAAGEVAGGIHAGNRLGGNALTDIIVFGQIAGENAALEERK